MTIRNRPRHLAARVQQEMSSQRPEAESNQRHFRSPYRAAAVVLMLTIGAIATAGCLEPPSPIPDCGDGEVNPQTGEECDAGDIDAGATCNEHCKTPECGDGQADVLALNTGTPSIADDLEQCDTGGDSDSCDADCTLPVCGDGHLNLAAGEQCDDGNTSSGDRCSSTCQVEASACFAQPSARFEHATAYDAARGRVVLFGGFDGELSDDIWEWDGQAWQSMPVSGDRPTARWYHAMAYDGKRQRIVVFGGNNSTPGTVGDTWEWDGQTWYFKSDEGGPSRRMGAKMVYDSKRERIVLFGGYQSSGELRNDMWAWDGAVWREIDAGGDSAPPPRYHHTLAYDGDRDRIVLFGGTPNSNAGMGDTWEWDGTNWHEIATDDSSPSARYDASMVYAPLRGSVVLFGGFDYRNKFGDTWEWNGQRWHPIEPQGTSPSSRSGHALVYDSGRNRILLFGGYGEYLSFSDTWEWDTAQADSAWQLVLAPPARNNPSPRTFHAMAYDPERARLVVFGGTSGIDGTNRGDTWEWDGNRWHLIEVEGERPAPRHRHGMAYDAVGRRILLFGGGGDQTRNDTWGWDGHTWELIATDPAHRPPERERFAMASDPDRGRIVLYGGYGRGYLRLDDTWEWDGSAWHHIPIAEGESPPARLGHTMTYDPNAGRMLMFGGQAVTTERNNEGELIVEMSNDTWTWDGSAWREMDTQGNSPSARAYATMTYHAGSERIMLFGGYSGKSDTWEWLGNTWLQPEIDGDQPPRRYGYAMAYDANRDRTVLFGGYDGYSYNDDTWEWDGDSWHHISTCIEEPQQGSANGLARRP